MKIKCIDDVDVVTLNADEDCIWWFCFGGNILDFQFDKKRGVCVARDSREFDRFTRLEVDKEAEYFLKQIFTLMSAVRST